MRLSRRRFLTIASAACLVAPPAQAFRWQGIALGAQAQIILHHPDAARICDRAAAEIDRLEDIFSLYRPRSELCRLNAAGSLGAPSFELLDCLSTARLVHRTTEGRFDPTVQPLWRLLAEAWARGRAPALSALGAARGTLGFDRVAFESGHITLADRQELTLNGIAQGYIADRVAVLMRRHGVEDVLIDTGEIVAAGAPGGRKEWAVTIAGESVPTGLSAGRALATSAMLGTVLDPEGRVGHIVDPRHGEPAMPRIRQISVSAGRAALADALSTALCLARDDRDARRLVSEHEGARLESVHLAEGAL